MSQHKYRAKPVTVDGHRFPSKAEARRYGQLQLLVRAGKITDLRLQPRFVLQEKFRHEGRILRAITYTADFAYRENGIEIVEDVKGIETPVFRLKWKLFLARFRGIDARIVKM